MSEYRGMQLRRRDASTFDPTDRIAQMRWWSNVDRGLTTSGGNFASLLDLSGNGHSGLPVAGKNLPAIVGSDTTLGNKASLQWIRDGVGQPILVAGVDLTPPFTLYYAGYLDTDQGVYQTLFMGSTLPVGNFPFLWTTANNPNDLLYMDATNEITTSIVLAGSAFILTAIFNVSGAQSGVARNSETLDATRDLGASGASGFVLGTDRTYSNICHGRFGEAIILNGVDTKAQQRDMIGYLQGRYPQPIDFDPPGTLFRAKYSVNLVGGLSVPAEPLASMISASGAARIYTRWRGAFAEFARADWIWGQYNSGAGPFVEKTVDDTVTVTAGGVTYASEIALTFDAAHETEVFAVLGGGAPPSLFFRLDGTAGAWIPIPIVGSAMAAITSPSGTVNQGKDPSTGYVQGTWHEVNAFTDGAYPAGVLPHTYPAGVIVLIGDQLGFTPMTGGWPAFMLRDCTKAYPLLRCALGSNTASSYQQMNTGRSAVSALFSGATGAQNVVIVGGGARGAIVFNGRTPAQAYSDLQTLCTNLRTDGATKILVGTITSQGSLSDADRATFNGLCTGGGLAGYADGVIDWAANATLGASGANSNTTYFMNSGVGSGLGLTQQGARIAGPIAAAALSAVLV
jgi:hypothetical protein